MQRLGMILFRILRALALLWLPVAIWFVLQAPLDKLMAFMLFAMPSIILYVVARLIRRVLVGPEQDKPRRTRRQVG